MVAERVEYQLYIANVSGGECEAIWRMIPEIIDWKILGE